MKCVALTAAMILLGAGITRAQSDDTKGSSTNTKGSSAKKHDRQDQSDKSRQQDDEEARIRYNGDRDRLSVNVHEDYSIPEDAGPSWEKNGDFDIRYDADKNLLKLSGSGTVDVDRAASKLALVAIVVE